MESLVALRDLSGRVLDVFAGFFDVFSEAPDGATTRAEESKECGGENEGKDAFC